MHLFCPPPPPSHGLQFLLGQIPQGFEKEGYVRFYKNITADQKKAE